MTSPRQDGGAIQEISRFLVVDDDAVTRLMLCRFLEKLGYQAVAAGNGQESLERVEEEMPDVVLMDAKMPVMDGFDATIELRKRPDARHIPIIMITGLNDDESVDRAFEVGATDFITKPIHWAILRNRMSYLLKAIKSEKELYLAAGVFESTTEGIAVTDGDGVIQSVNPSFSRITGYASGEAVGRGMNLLKSGRHDQRFYDKMWRALLEGGSWQGEIWNRRKNGEIYPEWANINAIQGPDGRTSNYVTVFSDLTAIKESEESLIYITGHDALTDLPNRLLFNERLVQALTEAEREKKQVGAILLDLDRFKIINDTMGHDIGDLLLKAVGERLRPAIPSNGALARLGGDEFGMVLPMIDEPTQAADVARAILERIKEPVILDDVEISISMSLGISIYPLDGKDAKTLMKNADAAMYHAKEQGRNNFQFFRAEFNTYTLARILMESSLRNALDREEFLLHYQPQVDIRTGQLVGVESLVRWRHLERGMISPGEFIPLAEETGIIVPIGRWVLEEACRQAKRWIDQGLPPLRVAVNLSSLQFKQPDFSEMVKGVLDDVGLDPKYLELELTESVAMANVEDSLVKMDELADMGFQLAIDDFGTGFSSLSYLKRFPIHTLKIDRSFIRDCTTDSEDAAIIRTVVGLGKSLNLRVIAEGVEEPSQLELLRTSECDEVQGYLFSRPQVAEEFQAFYEDYLISDQNK